MSAEDRRDDDEDGDDGGRLQRDEPELLQPEREHEVPALLVSVTHSSPVGASFGLLLSSGRCFDVPRKSAARLAESAHADGSLHLPR